jgi:thioester reductase-like protein
MAEKGLCVDFETKSVQFLHTDLSKPYLGLDIDAYCLLLQNVTHILHNAWPVNFNASLRRMVPHLQGTQRLINFSTGSRYGASVFFVSSIGAVISGSWVAAVSTGGFQIPEASVHDWSVAGNTGYPQSKLIAERIVETAARVAGVRGVICRVGQVAGPTSAKGMWPKQEWLPGLLQSSKVIGSLPDTLGSMHTIDWVPVDHMAKSMVELCFSDSKAEGSAAVYHTVNPAKTTWQALLPILKEHLGISSVPIAEWTRLVSTSKTQSAVDNPALKLLGFYEGLAAGNIDGDSTVELDTSKSQQASETLRKLQAIDSGLMVLWMRQLGLIEAEA